MKKSEVYLKALKGIQVDSQKDIQLKGHLSAVYKALEELSKDGLVFELAEREPETHEPIEWPKWIDGQVYESESAYNDSRPKAEIEDKAPVSKADTPVLSKPLDKDGSKPLEPIKPNPLVK